MPKIPKRLPFSRQFTAPEDQMFMHRRNGRLIRSNMDPEVWSLPYTPVQGPRLPDRVERARQRYLDALEEYRAERERMKEEAIYNRSLPERAARLKQEKWDKFLADENHPAYFEDDMDQLFDDEVYDELDERNRFW